MVKPRVPIVLCVCLTRDRPEMLQRAVRSFQAQTYNHKRLLVFDTGVDHENGAQPECLQQVQGLSYWHRPEWSRQNAPIGKLRNIANSLIGGDIIAHWDDDDWSHPERLAEQVRLLRDKQAVGYRECLFWADGEAWRYSHPSPRYCIGSSLCYWRSVWESKPFPDSSYGEDTEWLRNIDSLGERIFSAEPRMICSIHGDNTCSKIVPDSQQWRIAHAWKEYCRERMAL